ncbi:MAG: phosphate transport system permease protein [Haloarculaceae archaeon]|jgi:phosphate transport system permease protein
MSDAYASTIVTEESSLFDRFAKGALGLAVGAFLLSMATLFQFVTLDVRAAGIALTTLFGLALLGGGLVVASLGIVSRYAAIGTTPDATAGLSAGLAFGGFVSVVVVPHLVGAVLGFSGISWLVVTLVGVVAGTALLGVTVVLPREDLGSTLPPATVTTVVGIVLTVGAIDPGWGWDPTSLVGGFTAAGVVPLLVGGTSLLLGWSAAKTYGGFGAKGRELGAYFSIYVTAYAMLGVMVLIVGFVVQKGARYALRGLGISGSFPFVEIPFVMHSYIPLSDKINGILPAIVGTAWLVVGATIFAVPLGVGAAVFLTEYAEQGRFTLVVETATNALWSTPSIVFGLFGYAFLLPRVSGNDQSLLAGMLVLGFMLLPLVLITSREAIKSVPDAYRDASAALGVSKWQTVRSVVLPAAVPGIITGAILGIGRIAGETAPLLLVLGSQLNAMAPTKLFAFTGAPPFVSLRIEEGLLASTSALPTQIWAVISHGVSGPMEKGWGTAFVLLALVLTFYAIGISGRLYFRRKLDE